jgi:hypothetical protein
MQSFTTLKENLKDRVNSQRVGTLSKVYVWSICLEPLLFFLIKNPLIGLSPNISRYLQTIVLLVLASRFFLRTYISRAPNLFAPQYRMLSYYIIFTVFSGLYGIHSGAYTVRYLSLSETIDVSVIRPLTEYIIALYYFLYFVVLPRYLLNSPVKLNYFFKIFKTTFYFSLFIGFVDLILVLNSTNNFYEGIPRHISDMVRPGSRFHGIAGEPRDAFVYLILGIGILSLKDLWRNERKLTKITIGLIVLAALLTQSASGFIGLLFSSALLLIFYLKRVPPNKVFPVIILSISLILTSFIGAINSSRVMLYYDAFLEVFETLSAGYKVTSILKVTMNNIYPMWQRWLEVLDWNLIPTLIGTGFGSSSVLNNIFIGGNEVLNANSNLVRTVFDSGIIGTLILIIAFISPIKLNGAPKRVVLKFTLLMLLVLGAYFAHRSVAPFLFLGIILVVFKQKFIYPLYWNAQQEFLIDSNIPQE